MKRYDKTCKMTQKELINEFFIEHRVQVLEIAAFLDRCDRAKAQDAEGEFRYEALRQAIAELTSDTPGRVGRIQMLLSDRDVRLLEERDQQSAWGAAQKARVV